jgi:hypothetical protein
LENFANEKSFDAYKEYLALKRHLYSDDYDYFKYSGKVKTSFNKFQTRKDVYFFNKIASKQNYRDIILANLLKDKSIWVGDIISSDGLEIYSDWKKRIDSLSYIFKSDLNKLDEDYKSNFLVINGQHPKLLTLYLQKQITLESFAILIHISKAYDYLMKEMVDKFLGCDIVKLSKKYKPFLEIEEKKFSNMIKFHFFEI